jgi:hydrogenase-4 membrane subunit HyfE
VKEPIMEKDLPDPALVASARQIMDIPEEDEMQDEEAPLYITWFALGHAAVLLYLALHVLKVMSPMERGLAGGTTLLVGLTLALLLRSKIRTAMAMADVVAPGAGETAR